MSRVYRTAVSPKEHVEQLMLELIPGDIGTPENNTHFQQKIQTHRGDIAVLEEFMTEDELIRTLRFYLPKSFSEQSPFLKTHDGKVAVQRLLNLSSEPLSITHVNQLLHLSHEAGMTEGFFKYYFLSFPDTHPYPVDRFWDASHLLSQHGIGSLTQLEFGLKRFFTDALLFWGNIRSAYRDLRTKTFDEITAYFSDKRYKTESLTSRSDVLPFQPIPVDDRYLISEMACKAYSKDAAESVPLLESILLNEYKKRGGGRLKIASLFDQTSPIAIEDPQMQLLLQTGAEEFMEETVDSESSIRKHVEVIAQRFYTARESAMNNTSLYLSMVNELDVYIATSMRKRADFKAMAEDCRYIFNVPGLASLKLRYFDPTMSAADGHEDKGLIECLMVKCANVVLYFAGDGDSYGKDAEIAMAMSLGKPAIVLCPDSSKGRQREKIFRDIHPLSRLIEFDTGVAIGSMVTRSRDVAASLLERIFTNRMEYELSHDGNGYYRLKERMTGSVVRLHTSSRLLRETFWNYYHGVQ